MDRADRAGRIDQLRKSEIQHLHRAVRRDLDVRGLEVAVNDALLVRRFERLRDLLARCDRLVRRNGAARNPIGDGLALDELEDQRQ